MANEEDDEVKRLGYLTLGFGLIMANIYRRDKKFFNPLKGETYEYIDGNFKFMAEQVSHHPPVYCFHAENEHFIYSGYE